MEFIAFFNDIKVFVAVLHVVSAVCAMGAAFMSDILFNFYRADRTLSRMEIGTLAVLSRVVWYGLFAVIISGGALFLSDPGHYLASAKFLAKMTIVGVLIVNGIMLDRYVWRHMLRGGFLIAKREAGARAAAFVCGVVSLVSWIFALTLGMLHGLPYAYSSIMAAYGIILAIGISIALIVEWFAYEKRI